MLAYTTSIVFDKKYFETSPLSVKPTYHDANHGNTSTAKRGKEAINAKETVQSDEKWIQSMYSVAKKIYVFVNTLYFNNSNYICFKLCLTDIINEKASTSNHQC